MPFKPGNNYGGKREGAGRPTKKDVELKQTAAQIARDLLEERTREIMASYLQFAHNDPATSRHAVDKIIPDLKDVERERTLTVNIAQAIKITEPGLEPELRGNSLQIRIGGSNGKDGNGTGSA
jgi:hypothetical protein